MLAGASVGTGPWTISDFWLDESAAYLGAADVLADQRQLLGKELEVLASQVCRPKLLVLLDASGPLQSSSRQMADRLRALASRPGVGPLLRVESTATLSAEQQVLAAVLAMQ
jgi:hypothetical protein